MRHPEKGSGFPQATQLGIRFQASKYLSLKKISYGSKFLIMCLLPPNFDSLVKQPNKSTNIPRNYMQQGIVTSRGTENNAKT